MVKEKERKKVKGKEQTKRGEAQREPGENRLKKE
jgi:hypothetical protein